jgi:nicotinamidase-related amidase
MSKSGHRASASSDLHGNAPDQCPTALVLVDVINDFDFETGPQLFGPALRAARKLRGLKQRAARAGIPCIYVNDNYGRWRSDFTTQVRHSLAESSRGAPVVELLAPEEQDYFVLKPKHSGFYQTCLSVLLEHLGAETLIIAGFATDNCVTFTATDAYLRGHQVVIPKDGTATVGSENHQSALKHLERVLHARVLASDAIGFSRGRIRTRRTR